MSSAAEDMDADPFKRAKGDDASDRCGLSIRGKPPLLRLASRQGVFWIPTHCVAGIDEFKDRFVLHFRATLGWEVEGERKAMEGCWTATVTGERLDSILNHLGTGTRAKLNPGGARGEQEPFVATIDVEPVETVVFEAPRP